VAVLRHAAALRAQGLSAAAACAQALAASAPGQRAPEGERAGPLADLTQRLCDAALAMDVAQAGAMLAEAATMLNIEALWTGVVAPSLVELGKAWEQGTATA